MPVSDSLLSFETIDKIFDAHCHDLRIVAVNPVDDHSAEVMCRCLRRNICALILCVAGQRPADLDEILADDRVTVIDCADVDDAARQAVAAVRRDEADVIFKGNINTDNLLRAVLDKELGLLDQGRVMTHLAAAHIPGHHKLLFFADAAVIPYPDAVQFEAMARYSTAILHFLGVGYPKIALIHFTEKENPKFEVTTSYGHIKKLVAEGLLTGAIVEGPMDVKTACDLHSAEIKKISGEVSGHADMLIFPDLEAANTFYKTISCFAHATMAGMICGCRVPIVIPSRADSVDSKYTSLALACVAQKAFAVNAQ